MGLYWAIWLQQRKHSPNQKGKKNKKNKRVNKLKEDIAKTKEDIAIAFEQMQKAKEDSLMPAAESDGYSQEEQSNNTSSEKEEKDMCRECALDALLAFFQDKGIFTTSASSQSDQSGERTDSESLWLPETYEHNQP